jgi:hypothetical protein
MELRRWLWIALVLQTLIWSLFFVFGFYGFAETFANAPESWWADYGFDYWVLVVVGFASLPAYHLVAWAASWMDRRALINLGAATLSTPLWRRSLEHVGGMLVWGLWLACLITVFGHLEIPPAWPDYTGSLLNFTPVELTLWAGACGLATLTALALRDQMAPKHAELGVRAMLLHLACYVWFYLTYESMETNPSDRAWLLVLIACLMALPMARILKNEEAAPALSARPEQEG